MNAEIHNLFYRAPREPHVRVKNSILHFNPHQPLCACLPTMCTQPNNTQHYMENTPITTIAMLPTPPCHRRDCCRKLIINNPPPRTSTEISQVRAEVDHNNNNLLALSLSHCHTSITIYLSLFSYNLLTVTATTPVIPLIRSRAVEVQHFQ